MSKRFMRVALAISVIVMLLVAYAAAAQALTAGVVMTVSRAAQDSVVNEGEDLTIDVNIDGAEPRLYIWYFEDQVISGASSRVFSITSADASDAGLYRVEAYDENGKMLVSMEFSVRVITKALPKSGDDTLGIGAVAGVMALGASGAAALMIRRRCAA